MRRSSGAARRRRPARHERGRALAEAFRDAYGDPIELARLLAADVRVVVDTGGIAGAAQGPAVGTTAALTLLRVALGAPAAVRLDVRPVNGAPGLLATRDGVVVAVVALEGDADGIAHVWAVTNPAKLRGWG
jgi:RNA polymerase sigma-70 factor (ECF subfamily)